MVVVAAPLPPPAFALSELRLGKPSLREGSRAEASAKADRQSQQTLACAVQKIYADFCRGAARCFDCSRAGGVVMTAAWSLVRSHSKRRPLPVRTGGGFRFFRMSGRLARLAGAASSSRANSVRGTMQNKDRLAAVSPKSDQVFCSGGCDSGGVLPLPALAQEKGPSMTPGPFILS